jgi:hypothetical protein
MSLDLYCQRLYSFNVFKDHARPEIRVTTCVCGYGNFVAIEEGQGTTNRRREDERVVVFDVW